MREPKRPQDTPSIYWCSTAQPFVAMNCPTWICSRIKWINGIVTSQYTCAQLRFICSCIQTSVDSVVQQRLTTYCLQCLHSSLFTDSLFTTTPTWSHSHIHGQTTRQINCVLRWTSSQHAHIHCVQLPSYILSQCLEILMKCTIHITIHVW